MSACLHDNIPEQNDVANANATPVADAGPDREVILGTRVLINGEGSSDLEGSPLSYHWEIVKTPDGAPYILSSPNTPNLEFSPTARGPYLIRLHVSDGELTSEPDDIIVTGINTLPVSKPAYRNVLEGNQLTLDGSFSRDRDGHQLSYHWTLSARPAGSQGSIISPHTAISSMILDIPGAYVIHLTVDDGFEKSRPEMMVVEIGNIGQNPQQPPVINKMPPHARAGNDIILFSTNREYVLDASDSHDPNGFPMSFSWKILSKPPTSQAFLIESNSATPKFTADIRGSYVFQVTVTNSANLSSYDTVNVTDKRLGLLCADCHNGEIATGPLNHPPVVRNLSWDCGRCHKISTWATGALIPGNELFDDVTQGSLGPNPTSPQLHIDVNSRCIECHKTLFEALTTRHPFTSTRCNACHTTTNWQTQLLVEHNKSLGKCINCHNTDMPPTHQLTTADCGLCHDKTDWKLIFNDAHSQQPKSCVACHDVALKTFHDFHDVFGDRCENCHLTNSWIPQTLDYHQDFFNDCYYCHNDNISSGKGAQHIPVSNRCEACHSINTFNQTWFFDHDETDARCVACHPDPSQPSL